MEVELLMREIIKPYHETPHHLRTFKLSILDQMIPSVYFSSIFFYPMNKHLELQIVTAKLKESLAKTLAYFYPLGGKINDNFQIDCNDQGISYMEARVGCYLSDFLQQPRLESLSMFYPNYTICSDLGVQLAIQVNIFSCGGIAIGMSFLHKLVDASTMSTFFKTWAATARDALSLNTTDYDSNHLMTVASTLFPPREELPARFSWQVGSTVVKPGESIQQRFVFNAKAISELRDKAASDSVPRPTRVEAISALIWKCAIKAFEVASGGSQECNSVAICQAVDLRRRMQPLLSEKSLGNLIWCAVGCLEKTSSDIEFPKLVSLVRTLIAKFDRDYVQRMTGDDGFEAISKTFEDAAEMNSTGKIDTHMFSSWCKMGFDEVNFGWGKPIWVTPGTHDPDAKVKNVVILVETAADDGIEAWLALDEHEMAVLENDPDFLSFAVPNPSIFFETP